MNEQLETCDAQRLLFSVISVHKPFCGHSPPGSWGSLTIMVPKQPLLGASRSLVFDQVVSHSSAPSWVGYSLTQGHRHGILLLSSNNCNTFGTIFLIQPYYLISQAPLNRKMPSGRYCLYTWSPGARDGDKESEQILGRSRTLQVARSPSVYAF